MKQQLILGDFTGGFSRGETTRNDQSCFGTCHKQSHQVEGNASPGLPYYDFSFPSITEKTIKPADRLDVNDAVCIVGFGEIGPFGNARIRWDHEKGNKACQVRQHSNWRLAGIGFKNAEWVDAETGEGVDINTLTETYDLNSRIGLRLNELFDPEKVVSFTEVVLTEDTTFVPELALAEAYLHADPSNTEIFKSEDGYTVVRKKGAKVRVPKLDPIDRNIAGQMPTGYDPTRLGVDAQSVDQIDPVAIYNLIATSDAFRSAGLTPEDLWQTYTQHESQVPREVVLVA